GRKGNAEEPALAATTDPVYDIEKGDILHLAILDYPNASLLFHQEEAVVSVARVRHVHRFFESAGDRGERDLRPFCQALSSYLPRSKQEDRGDSGHDEHDE